MKKNKRIKIIFGRLFLITFVVSSILISASVVDNARQQFATNVLHYKSRDISKLKVPRRGVRKRQLLAQVGIRGDIATLCAFVTPEKPQYKAEFIALKTSVETKQGEEFAVSLYVKNTGNVPWLGDASLCGGNYTRLGTARDRDRGSVFYNPGDKRWINQTRIAMAEPRVDPGEIATFSFSSHAPYVSDIFREYFQPVVENVEWIEGKNTIGHVDIYIGKIDAENEKRLFYLGKSGQASMLDIRGEPLIDIDISEQKMRVKLGETLIREYTVSTGTFKTPTPLGRFKILNKQTLRISAAYPHYHMPFWQGFTQWGHGLHALPYLANDRGVFWNEALNHIGQRVSHGCIRILNEDAEDLYNLTEVGMVLVVHE